MLVIISWLTAFVSIAPFALSATPAFPVRIEGLVKLPPGHVAPKGGMPVELTAIVDNYEYQCKHCFDGDVTIPEGKSFVRYSIEIKATDRPKYRIRFFQPLAGFARGGYRIPGGAVPYMSDHHDAWIDITKGSVTGVDLTIPRDASIPSYQETISLSRKRGEEIAASILKPHFTEFEKALAVHDYIVNHLVYFSEEAAKKNRLSTFRDVYTDHIPLLTGVAICGTYSSAFDLLAETGGLRSSTVKTVEQGAHAWNEVWIGGQSYQLDTTHNDDSNGFQYERFLASRDQMEKLETRPFHKSAAAAREPFKFAESMYVHRAELSDPRYRRIIGNVYLPEGEVAPRDGMWITVKAETDSGSSPNVRLFIPQGQGHTFFALRVEARHAAVKLGFQTDAAGYAPNLYYSASGPMVTAPAAASKLVLVNGDVTLNAALRRPTGNEGSPIETNRHVHLMSKTTGRLLRESAGRVTSESTPAKGQLSGTVWILVEAEQGYVRLKNADSGCYLHTENQKGFLQCDPSIGMGWWSAMWKVTRIDSRFAIFENRWSLADNRKVPAVLTDEDSSADASADSTEVFWELLPAIHP